MPNAEAENVVANVSSEPIVAYPTAFPFKLHNLISELPLFSLSRKPSQSKEPHTHDIGNGRSITVIPSSLGSATIDDEDIIIYLGSVYADAMKRGVTPSREMVFRGYTFAKAIKPTASPGAKDYKRLNDGLARIAATTFRADFQLPGHKVKESSIPPLLQYSLVKNERTGRLEEIKVTLSDVLARCFEESQMLTYVPAYFDLHPFNKRLYQLCRKHCGNQSSFTISLEKLYQKFGTKVPIRRFRFELAKIAETQPIPHYIISLNQIGGHKKRYQVVIQRDGVIPGEPGADASFRDLIASEHQ